MTVRRAAGATFVAIIAASLVACGSKGTTEVASSISPGTTVPSTASPGDPIVSAAQITAAMSACSATADFVQSNATAPPLSAFVGAWLRCGPPGAMGDVGYVFTADGEIRFLVADGGEVTTAYSPTTFAAQFPLIPTTTATATTDPDGARISVRTVSDGEIFATFADHDVWQFRAAFLDAPPRMTIFGDFDTGTGTDAGFTGSTYTYVRIDS